MQNWDGLFHDLEMQGWAVADDLLSESLVAGLISESQNSWKAGEFQDAHIGRGSVKQHVDEVRGDSIRWLEFSEPGLSVHEFLIWASALRSRLNERYFLGLKSEEFHFARYPVGKGYRKHVDQHRGQSSRKISLVLYLNPQWNHQDGGQLRLFSTSDANVEVTCVTPSLGRLVLFRSDLVPHEVLPCFQIRWSLTGWFRTDF